MIMLEGNEVRSRGAKDLSKESSISVPLKMVLPSGAHPDFVDWVNNFDGKRVPLQNFYLCKCRIPQRDALHCALQC